MSVLDEMAKRVRLIGASLDVSVLYPGVDQTPPHKGGWLELHFFMNDGEDYAVGNGAVERGFFRVFCCSRPGKGLSSALQLADKIVDLLPKGTTLGDARTDTTPTVSGPIIESDKIFIPVTIRYRSFRS